MQIRNTDDGREVIENLMLRLRSALMRELAQPQVLRVCGSTPSAGCARSRDAGK